MTVKELAEEILEDISSGRLDPNTVVVRPLCMCDQNVGYVEAKYLDPVVRRWDVAEVSGSRVYRYGNVEASETSALTVKLG